MAANDNEHAPSNTDPTAAEQALRNAINTKKLYDVMEIYRDTPGMLLDYRLPLNQTWLHLASATHHWTIVDYLLEINVPLEVQDENGETALHIAIEKGQYDIAKRLLQKIGQREDQRAIINLRGSATGRTVLHEAARKGHIETVRALLLMGADVSLTDSNQETPIQVAIKLQMWDTLVAMFEMTGEPIRGRFAFSSSVKLDALLACQYAIRAHDWELVKRIVSSGVASHPDRLKMWHDACDMAYKSSAAGEKAIENLIIPGWESSRYKDMALMARVDLALPGPKHIFGWWEMKFPSHFTGLQTGLDDPTEEAPEGLALRRRATDAISDPASREPTSGEPASEKPTAGKLGKSPLQREGASTAFIFPANNSLGILALVFLLEQENSLSQTLTGQFWRDITSERQYSDPNHPNAMKIRLRDPAYKKISDTSFEYLSLVMPCFHYSTLGAIDSWRDPRKSKKCLSALNDVWSVCKSESFEPFRVHMPLTLDEYCSPALPRSVLNMRNRDQIILKAHRDKVQNSDGKFSPNTPILAISQIWVWELEDVVIISPASPNGKQTARMRYVEETITSQAAHATTSAVLPTLWGYRGLSSGEMLMDIGSYLNEASTSEDRMRAIGIMLSDAVDFLEHPLDRHDEPILNIYERYITVVGQKADAYSREQGLANFFLEEERKYLHDIDDIRAELSMIKRVILQQEEVWKDFASNTWPQYWQNESPGRMAISPQELFLMKPKLRNEWLTIMRPQSQFVKYHRRITQLDEDAERVERGILAKLDLKSKHAGLKEAHAAGVISAAVLGFTVITIIFTPLSFVTGLFALSIDQLQKHQIDWLIPGPQDGSSETNASRAYSAKYIAKWAVTTEFASIAVALAAMWLAVEYTVEEPLAKKLLSRFWQRLNARHQPKEETPEPYPDDLEPESGASSVVDPPPTQGKLKKFIQTHRRWMSFKNEQEDDEERVGSDAASGQESKGKGKRKR